MTFELAIFDWRSGQGNGDVRTEIENRKSEFKMSYRGRIAPSPTGDLHIGATHFYTTSLLTDVIARRIAKRDAVLSSGVTQQVRPRHLRRAQVPDN